MIDAVAHARSLLSSATPETWFRAASGNLSTLLIDHANCEKKAAGTALSLLYRYVDKPELLRRMSRLAREELRHYEQVLAMIDSLGYAYGPLTPGRYVGAMRALVRTSEPGRLIDTLIVGAIVEARSCERFEGLANRFDGDLGAFYARLLESEARHANVYLDLARRYVSATAGDPAAFDSRLSLFVERDRLLVITPDEEFRFHSGPPAQTEST